MIKIKSRSIDKNKNEGTKPVKVAPGLLVNYTDN